jgi:hypothetical protein
MPQQTGTPGSRQDVFILGNNSKKVLAQLTGVPSGAQYRRRLFLSCAQREKDMLTNFYRRFL